MYHRTLIITYFGDIIKIQAYNFTKKGGNMSHGNYGKNENDF